MTKAKATAPLEESPTIESDPAWRGIQTWLKQEWDYAGKLNGIPDEETWEALTRYLVSRRRYGGEPLDTETQRWAAVQRWLRDAHGYAGVIDGVPGRLTDAALRHVASLPVDVAFESAHPKVAIDGEESPALWARLQLWAARDAGYDGPIDGEQSDTLWSAIQSILEVEQTGTPDAATWGALQATLRRFGYEGQPDAEPGPLTMQALQRFANAVV